MKCLGPFPLSDDFATPKPSLSLSVLSPTWIPPTPPDALPSVLLSVWQNMYKAGKFQSKQCGFNILSVSWCCQWQVLQYGLSQSFWRYSCTVSTSSYPNACDALISRPFRARLRALTSLSRPLSVTMCAMFR